MLTRRDIFRRTIGAAVVAAVGKKAVEAAEPEPYIFRGQMDDWCPEGRPYDGRKIAQELDCEYSPDELCQIIRERRLQAVQDVYDAIENEVWGSGASCRAMQMEDLIQDIQMIRL